MLILACLSTVHLCHDMGLRYLSTNSIESCGKLLADLPSNPAVRGLDIERGNLYTHQSTSDFIKLSLLT